MCMVILQLLIGISSAQKEFTLALMDLTNDPLTAIDWNVQGRRQLQSYTQVVTLCNLDLFILNPIPNVYQKTYTIPHYDYGQLIIEMDVYFIQFSSSFIRIKIDQKIIYQQTFSYTIIQQSKFCSDIDYQYTISQKFFTNQKQFTLQIYHQPSLANSKIGIKNINIYTNGYQLSNGCTMEQPYLQGSSCVQFCTLPNPYLGGVDMLVCQTDQVGQSNLIGSHLTTQLNLWKFSDPNPTVGQQQYLNQNNFLFNNNQYNNIMYSNLFSSTLSCSIQCFYLRQSIQSTYLLQITLVFYIFGEWDEGSQVGLYIQGDTIYSNNMAKINQVRGSYLSSTGSQIYFTNITSITGISTKVRRTLITFQGNFYSSAVTIGFSQLISGSGSYGFGDIYVYQSYGDANILYSTIYGIPYQCIPNYYAYNGYCVQNCPPYSYKDVTNNNCTDLSQQYSKYFDTSQRESNNIGIYIIKDFYDNNFNQQTINQLFNLVPSTYTNYQNGQPYSFIGNKKILGGFNSWGSGSYGIYVNLPAHNKIRIKFKLYMIDDWAASDVFICYIDDQRMGTYYQDNKLQNIQGQSNFDQVYDLDYGMDFQVYHSSRTLRLFFNCQIAKMNSSLASCGISDLFVLYYEFVDIKCNLTTYYYSYVTNNCENCANPGCLLFPTNYYTGGFSTKEMFGCMQRDQQVGSVYCQECSQPAYTPNYNDYTCECEATYIYSDGLCAMCHYTCNTCSGITQNDCTSCDSSRLQIGSKCQCLPNSYDEFSQQNCKTYKPVSQCNYVCGTCFGVKYNKCVTCPNNSFRTITLATTCLCDQQYMDVGLPVCQRIICDPSCLTCTGLLQSNCLLCQPNFRYDNGYCICDGQFNNLVDVNVCTLNTQTCNDMSCIDQSIEGLLDCDSNLSRYLNIISNQQQQCVCFDGYYELQGVCVICQQSCLTCQTTATNCLSCDSNNKRELNINQCDCVSGYNDKLTPGQSCVINYAVCHYSCNQCFGPSDGECLNCYQHRTLQGSSCPCVPQRFEDASSNSCLLCNSLCLTCYGDQFNNCLSCDQSLNRFIFQNTCICQQGYIEVDGVCNPCHYSCLSCLGMESQNCTDCDAQNFRSINYKNQCKCISGYADTGNKLCEKCPNECDDCDSQLKCIICKYQLQFINSAGRCECQQGYQKNNNGQCVDCQSEEGKAMFLCQYKNAQDGVWSYGEQCDDGNNESRDGCNNNQITYGYSCNNVFNQPSICYKCPSNCYQCQLQQNQVICISCYSNYFISQSECIQCLEESCIECNTSSYCTICNNQKIPIQGKCNTCDYGYYYQNNQCQSQCGDGIKTNYEQCDDGNLISNDGCSEICEIEDDFVCQTTNNKLSNCFLHEQPYLILNAPYQTSNKERQLIITVSQDVTYKDVQVQLKQNDQVQFQYYSSGTNSLIINVKLMFQQLYDQFTVDLTIKGSILNQYNQNLKNNKLQVIFSDIIILNNQQQQSSDQVSQLGQGVVITLTCLSVTSLLMGGISQFIIFLNLIQQLQYIQYINVDFPQNLIQFLNLFNGFTISPLFDLLQIEIPFFAPWQPVFAYNGINSYFIANMKGFMLCLLIFFILDFILKFAINLTQHYKHNRLEQLKLSNQQKRKINKIIRFLLRLSTSLRQQSLPQLVLTQCYDIQFAIFLQLTNPDINSVDVMMNFMLAIFIQFYFLKLTCNQFINSEIKDGQWQNLYNQLKLLQSLIFIFAIVQLQSFSQSQIILISISSLIVSYYMLYIQPFENDLNNFRLVLQESILFITILTFIAYIYFPSQINPINLGWFHISSLIFMLIGSVAIDIYYYVNIIKYMY